MRLRQRGQERYGDVIFTDPTRAEQSQTFPTWAAGHWPTIPRGSAASPAPSVLELHGDLSVAKRLQAVDAKPQGLGVK